jgi:glycolate oxidase
MTATDVVSLLRTRLGAAVSVDEAELDATRSDQSGHRASGSPLALVHARSAEDVQETMRIATETRTPVVPRGAGTGLAGGAIGDAGEIVLSTTAMTEIIEINPEDELAVVQPGIINADLNKELAASGLWFAPDPASRAISTVGGNIATNAGGLLCAKYGVTRESVLGLKVVLADGILLSLGHRTVKGVSGLDLTALMIGSEGTLGVIVEATLKLRRLVTGPTPTIGAYFGTIDAAARAASSISASGLRPAIMELVDQEAMTAIYELMGVPGTAGSYLLVQTDGPGAIDESAEALSIIRASGGEGELVATPDEAERLLAIRRSFHPALAARGRVLIEDVCVPRSALPAMFAAIAEIARRHDLVIPTVAHAGDGNLHPNFIIESGSPHGDGDVPEQIWAAADEVFREALRLGGTLTGEHGVGILKRRWLGQELGEDQLDLQRRLKQVFDPLGILNPGKVFQAR